MKYCQNPKCHYYNTNDRLKGSGENKTHQTRKASRFFYGGGNFCTLSCQNDWFDVYGNMAIDHFGRIITPKKRNKNAPNYYDLRRTTVERLYGEESSYWSDTVDRHRVSVEMDSVMTKLNNN